MKKGEKFKDEKFNENLKNMRMTLLKSKIHRAVVTESRLDYEGSISIDPLLSKAAHICHFEKVDIYNCNNGKRFSTYVIDGQEGEICLNGAAARLAQVGDVLIIVSYAEFEEKEVSQHRPQIVSVTPENKIKSMTKI